MTSLNASNALISLASPNVHGHRITIEGHACDRLGIKGFGSCAWGACCGLVC